MYTDMDTYPLINDTKCLAWMHLHLHMHVCMSVCQSLYHDANLLVKASALISVTSQSQEVTPHALHLLRRESQIWLATKRPSTTEATGDEAASTW